jgi:sterol desaturase/sphingolipid hydroxylase (fatty acid hydroxylase superfamily)
MGRKRSWFAGALLIGWGVGLLMAETRWPLRPVQDAKARRDARNGVFAVLSALVVTLLQDPIVQPLARRAEARHWGLLGRVALPRGLKTAATVLLMDYTLYVWHVLAHRVPFLWRFHRPHHADLEMDASTALRFHFGEMALSIPYRAAQVALIGVAPAALALWQRLTLASILFHHSNLRLPPALDRALTWLVVTPRLHEIHHSTYLAERETNWSSGLALWDRLHGTLQPVHLAAETTIGDPELRGPRALSVRAMLAAPFRRASA